MKPPVKTGLRVNGEPTTLENYLLNVVDRPLPNPPTHFLLIDVLNTDLSVKRVTIYFNPGDKWKGNYSFEENSPNGVGLKIGEGLAFLGRDPNTLAYQYNIVEIASGEPFWERPHMYYCTKCEF